MSQMLRAWYVFLALGFLSFILTAFEVRPPFLLSSTVALPHNILFRAGNNLRTSTETILERRDLRKEIKDLRQELYQLHSENNDLRIQLERHREALGVRLFQAPGLFGTASVIGIDPSEMRAHMTLGAGKKQGVRKFMPVTVPEGLVGLVFSLTENSSSVRMITDPSSRVGVTVLGKDGQGIAVGELGGLVRVIEYYQERNIEVGDQVVTQSRGGRFPRGIMVGEVIQVFPKDPNRLQVEFLVRPAANLNNILEVALINPL